MKRCLRLLVPLFCVIIISCNLDGWGWLISSDVDDRYADNQALSEPAGPGALAPPFSFVVIADTHVFGDNKAARFSAFRSRLDPTPGHDRFVIVCGDLVQNGALNDFQTYALEVTAIEAMGLSVYSVPGNHDLYNNGWPNYRSELGRSMYTFSAGPVRVIAIDSANGTLGWPQRVRLENTLAAKTEQFCVTFTHMQFFGDGITETQQWTDITEAYSLMHLFETRGVNIHFAGHTHSYLARTINGTSYVTAPGFSSGMVRVTVDAGSITWQKIDF